MVGQVRAISADGLRIRAGTIDFETGLTHATNTGHELADFTPPPELEAAAAATA